MTSGSESDNHDDRQRRRRRRRLLPVINGQEDDDDDDADDEEEDHMMIFNRHIICKHVVCAVDSSVEITHRRSTQFNSLRKDIILPLPPPTGTVATDRTTTRRQRKRSSIMSDNLAMNLTIIVLTLLCCLMFRTIDAFTMISSRAQVALHESSSPMIVHTNKVVSSMRRSNNNPKTTTTSCFATVEEETQPLASSSSAAAPNKRQDAPKTTKDETHIVVNRDASDGIIDQAVQATSHNSNDDNSSSTTTIDTATENDDDDSDGGAGSFFRQWYRVPKQAYKIYTSYAAQLWKDTDTDARTRIANDKVRTSVRDLSHLLHSAQEYNDNDDGGSSSSSSNRFGLGRRIRRRRGKEETAQDKELRQAQDQLLEACDSILALMPQDEVEEDQIDVNEVDMENIPIHTMAAGGSEEATTIHAATVEIGDKGTEEAKEPLSNSQSSHQTIEGSLAADELSQPLTHTSDELDTVTTTTSSSSSTDSVALIPHGQNGETESVPIPPNTVPTVPKKKQHRSILFGAAMGAIVACWVFSGNYIFTGIFCLMTILGQLEYYRMVMNTGVFPARRISVIGATSMFVTALFAPELHQICLPMFGLWAMVWKLTMRQQVATIPEIATTFTGMFYLGYVPSFWVRIRLLGEVMEPTRLYPFTSALRSFLNERLGGMIPSSFVKLPITNGAVFIFWSWISLAFSDVGAYFVGRKYGKTKLGTLSPAAGATSPNKSVEGVIGGCLTSAMFSIAGAWVQKWPYWFLTGAIHGTILGLLGLIGDLTASMLKRDAGLKDFGNLIPEHGGIMDRVDSFVWTAPYSWVVCAYIIPALKAACG